MRRYLGVAAVVSALASAGCHGRPRTWSASSIDTDSAEGRAHDSTKGQGDIAEIDLTGGAPETSGSGFFGTSSQPTYFRLVTLLREIAKEPQGHGVLLRFGSARFGWSHAQELAALLGKIRASHQTIVCHADGYGNSSMWMAMQGCDRIWVSPAGGVDSIGIAAEMVYANRLLTGTLGVDVDFLQIGKFKGAEEPFTRDGPSPEAKSSLEGVLGAIREQWLQGMTGARGPAIRDAVEDGPFSPDEAKKRGLVDAVGYLDEAREDAKKLGGSQAFDVRFGIAAHAVDRLDFGDVMRAVAGGTGSRGGPPHIVLVRAIGAISMEGGGGLLGQRSGITERALGRTVRALTEDATVKAVVLRIDSPGGSALASDLLWRALMQLRAKKTLIVSVGDMAASGGYYLASTAHRIVAEPTSIVGSIGVVGGKLAFGPALERFGVHVEAIGAPGSGSAKRASYESALTPWDPATRERVRTEMTAIYDLFVRRVAEGRGRTVEEIAGAAEGRIFAGEQAKDLHLVDEWGGIEQALHAARELAKLDENIPVRIAGESSSVFDWFDDDDAASDESADASWLSALERRAHTAASASASEGLSPEVASFLGSLAPLARGEKALTALPFALLLH